MEYGIPASLETPVGTLNFNNNTAADYFRLSLFTVTSPLRQSIDPVAGGDGAIVGPAFRGGAFPILEGQLVASSLSVRSTMLDQVRGWPDSIRDVDGTLRWTPTGKPQRRMLVRLADDVITRGDLIKEFHLALVAADARIYEETQTTVDSSILASGVGGTWSIPFTFPINFGTATTGGVATVVVGGQISTPPIIRIYGAISAPAVYNLTTGEVLSFPGLSIAAGDYVEVDVAKRTARVNGLAIASVAGYIDLTLSSYWLLRVGSNSIRLSGSNTDAGTKVTLLYRNAYR